MKTTSNVIDLEKYRIKKQIDTLNDIFGDTFVETYLPEYDTVTYTLTIEGEDYKITVPTEEFFDPN